jgi:hypothetical protein
MGAAEELDWISLANNPGSNRVAAGFGDTFNQDYHMATWDGAAWANTNATCSTTTNTFDASGIVLAEDSADEFVAYCNNGNNSVRECEWTSAGGWESTVSCASFDSDPDVGDDDISFIESRPLPGTNTGMVCEVNDLFDNNCWVWDGVSGTGGTRTLFEVTDASDVDHQETNIGFDWNPDQTTTRDALIVYPVFATSLSWGTWDDAANTFTVGSGTVSSTATANFVWGYRAVQSSETWKVHIARGRGSGIVEMYRWDGSTTAPGSLQTLTTSMSNVNTFSMALQANPIIGCTSHFDCVDDDPIHDENARYLISPATSQEEDFTLQDIATDITGIDQVTAFLWALAPNPGDTLTYVLAHGASVCATDTPTLTTAYVNYTRVYTQNCAGGPWTAANVNALEIRIENSVALDPRMTATGVVVRYDAVDVPDTPPVSQTFLVDFTYRVEGDTVYFLDRTRNVSGLGLTYRWQFGDGAESFVREAWHVYPPTIWGTYTVTLTVCDPFICKSAARNVTVVQWDIVMLVVIVVAIAFTYAWVRKMERKERKERNETVRRRGARR